MSTPKLKLSIDENDLAGECTSQASQKAYYAREAARAQDLFDRAKAKKDLAYAKLDIYIRRNPEQFHIGKISNDVVHNQIIAHSEYQDAVENELVAKKTLGEMTAAVDGLWSRDKMLGIMKDLHVHEYYESRKDTNDN